MTKGIQFSRKPSIMSIILAVAMGMGGELHLRFPLLGTIAMLDLFSYFVALPIILQNWNKMGRRMQLSLNWAFAWTGASMLANWFGFINTWYWFKCVALACSSWAIMAVAYIVLKKNAMLYLWYLVGAGIGGWIALYHFRNGAYEFVAGQGALGVAGADISNFVAKQIYPIKLKGIFLGILLPCAIVFKFIPVSVAIAVAFYMGFFVLKHGGSRSGFGVFCCSALIGFVVAYRADMVQRLKRHPVELAVILFVFVGCVFGTYKYMARSGKLTESERVKYEREFRNEGIGGSLSNRAAFSSAIFYAKKTLGVGAGGHNRCHSVGANSLACEGVVGFAFWFFFFNQCFWLMRYRIVSSKKYATFILLLMLWAIWDVIGSPFGLRYKFFVLMTFVAICQDNPMYGLGNLFEPLGFIPPPNGSRLK